MSIDRYFDKFPIITYGNTQIIDITKRVAVLESVSKNPYVFYPYEISENERADQLSFRYYSDPYKSWMLYLTNKITDPYYEWYLNDTEFNEFIINKYGSIEQSLEKIYFYRNNWASAEDISVARYNSLSDIQQGYWDPVYGFNNIISSYTRKQKDWISATNRIVSYAVSNSSFIKDEICSIVFDGTHSGNGQILSSTNNTIYVHHMNGTTVSNSIVTITANSYITGNTSGVNTVFTTSTLVQQNITAAEEEYWAPVYYYDYETERNKFNKTIRVIDNSVVSYVATNFKKLMSNN